MLAKAGLQRGDYSIAAVGATPQRWEAVRAGPARRHDHHRAVHQHRQGAGLSACSTHRSNVFPVYQGGSFAASRAWAAANPDALKGFIKGYLAGLDWTLKPENRQEATDTLLRNMPEIKPPVAGAVMTACCRRNPASRPRRRS